MEERGVNIDHATLNRWVIDYSPLIAADNFTTQALMQGESVQRIQKISQELDKFAAYKSNFAPLFRRLSFLSR